MHPHPRNPAVKFLKCKLKAYGREKLMRAITEARVLTMYPCLPTYKDLQNIYTHNRMAKRILDNNKC